MPLSLKQVKLARNYHHCFSSPCRVSPSLDKYSRRRFWGPDTVLGTGDTYGLQKKIFFNLLATPQGTHGMWDLRSWPSIRPKAPALAVQGLNHWIAREVLILVFFKGGQSSRSLHSSRKMTANSSNNTPNTLPQQVLDQLVFPQSHVILSKGSPKGREYCLCFTDKENQGSD